MNNKKKQTDSTITPELTESDKIWAEIKDLVIDIFSLPNQTVKQHVQRVKITPTELHLKLKSSAVIASLEEVLNRLKNSKFEIDAAHGYTVVRRTLPAPVAISVE